jgi:hypothetical protein
LGGNRTSVESNYFGKGNTTDYNRAVYFDTPFAPQDDFHNYTFAWSKEKVDWIIDGKTYRTLNYGDALGGQNFPQTPMQVHLGSWAGGDPRNLNGTIDWAGGLTDYESGPYTMTMKHVYIQDASTGSAYTWTDKSGSWQSIKAEAYVSRLRLCSSIANPFAVEYHPLLLSSMSASALRLIGLLSLPESRSLSLSAPLWVSFLSLVPLPGAAFHRHGKVCASTQRPRPSGRLSRRRPMSIAAFCASSNVLRLSIAQARVHTAAILTPNDVRSS